MEKFAFIGLAMKSFSLLGISDLTPPLSGGGRTAHTADRAEEL